MIAKKIHALRGLWANLLFVWGAYVLYSFLPFYVSFLRQETLETLGIIAIGYTLYGLITQIKNPSPETKGLLILRTIKKIFSGPYTKKKFLLLPKVTSEEKNATLFALVKIFFTPLMINFVYANANAILQKIPLLLAPQGSPLFYFNAILFPLILAALFFIDTLWFAFGYTIESKKLKNKVRSVEPTFIGWAVALVCYPPFNGYITSVLNWYANDYVLFANQLTTTVMRLVILLLLGIYVSATLALGAKSSNLTNRGIVSRGPYRFIRHPAYIAKNLAWWLTIIPVASIPAIISMGVWSTIYHLRSITEERHLKKDPDYVEYMKKVKYRYVPGLY